MNNTKKAADALRKAGYVIVQAPPVGYRWALVKDADGVERYQAVPLPCTCEECETSRS